MLFSNTSSANMAEQHLSFLFHKGPMPKHDIREWIDIFQARRALKALAAQVGFTHPECNELAIVASELGSNIIKYGVRGSLEMEPIENAEGSGVSVVARDFGPPFHDLAMALEDGCDDRGPIDPMQMLKRRGIGGGLGAVIRLTHSFHVHSLVDGKEIRVARYKKRLADKHRLMKSRKK